MRLVWITDVHLDHATERTRLAFLARLRDMKPDLLLVGGDTGEAPSVFDYLALIKDRVPCPIRYVLGNHDYYGGSIRRTQVHATHHAENFGDHLVWLPNMNPERLTPTTGLVGEGGWGDATYGDRRHNMQMNDHRLIEEFAQRSHSTKKLVKFAQELGRIAAKRLKEKLEMAVTQGYSRVIVLTHVPPYPGASWHEDHQGDPGALPWFCWGQGGDAISDVAGANVDVAFTVLTGHSHSPGVLMPLPNVTVITGRARYQRPEPQPPMEIL